MFSMQTNCICCNFITLTAVVTAAAKRKKDVADEITGLVNRVNRAVLDDRNLRVALTTTLSEHKARIFQRGKAADESQIGTYSTVPASISKKNQAKNTGKTYFKRGYAEYKSAIGKNPGYVILRDKDQMMSDYGLQGSAGEYGFGFQNQFNADKSGWNEDHFDKSIFALSEKEGDIVINVLSDLTFKAI